MADNKTSHTDEGLQDNEQNVQAIADTIRKPVGFTKNCFDLCNICITITVSLVFAHKLIGVGIGTVVAVLGVGRVIALFNKMCMKKMVTLAGVEY